MADTKSIDKLMHDLALEHARSYWDQRRRQKSQEKQLQQSAERNWDRQFKYLRAAGLNPDDIEKQMDADARYMRSHLEQIRPLLIARRGMAAETASMFASLHGGLLIPPNAGFVPGPDPNVVHPVDPSQIKLKDTDDGSGWGWPMATAKAPVPPALVMFAFVPHQNANYSFTASLTFHGFYVLQADDDWYTSKHASVSLDISLDAYQYIDRGWKSFPKPIDRESQNINEFDNFDQTLNFSDSQNFREGEPVIITARIHCSALSSGSGSHAEINFADGGGNFIQPHGLWVSPAP